MQESYAIALCIKQADPRGFEYLVNKYKREAFFHARMFLGNDDDLADAWQESFAKAFAAIRRIPVLDQFYPWFYRILKNTCLNMLSRRSTSQRYIQAKRNEKTVCCDIETPAFIVEKDEEQAKVWQILQQLKDESREILVLKYIQGLDYAEISQRLSIPRGTVMSRLYYARKVFKERYLGEEEFDKEVIT